MLPCYDLRHPSHLTAAIQDLRGYRKLWSNCLLRSCDLPTLDGLVVTRDLDAAPPLELLEFLRAQEPRAVLIRHDKSPESPPYPRGGFLVGERCLPQVMAYFSDLGRIIAAYEPANPFLNGYNANLLFESETEVTVEIVGPGFDASDLQRGDASPHESWSFQLSEGGAVVRAKSLHQTTVEVYRNSVEDRLKKIRTKLTTSPTQQIANCIRAELIVPDDLESYLQSINSPLLSAREGYTPVPRSTIARVLQQTAHSGILPVYRDEMKVGYPLVISVSFVNGHRLTYWDIVSASLKFEGTTRDSKGLNHLPW